MPLYEHTFLTRHNLTSQQATALTEEFSAVLTEGGGKVLETEYWGLRSLAYRIGNNRKAHYAFLRIDAPAPAVQEMERRMRINEDVLRLLTLRVEAHEEGPTAIMRAKVRRDARRPRGRDGEDTEGGEGPAGKTADATNSIEANAADSTKADAADSTKADAADSTKADAADSTKADAADSTKADAADSTKADAADSTKADAADSTKADAADSTEAMPRTAPKPVATAPAGSQPRKRPPKSRLPPRRTRHERISPRLRAQAQIMPVPGKRRAGH